MKISRNTKELIYKLKSDSLSAQRELEIIRVRIAEHPGTKGALKKLDKAIEALREWEIEKI